MNTGRLLVQVVHARVLAHPKRGDGKICDGSGAEVITPAFYILAQLSRLPLVCLGR
jgi:hypothetical protein